MGKTEKEGKQKEIERKEEQRDKKIVHILTDQRLSAIKATLEKDHAIDCLFLLMLGRGQWKYAKEFMKRLQLTLPDGTFRARMKEIEYNGLATHENIDAKKKRWLITEFGNTVGKLLLELFTHTAKGGTL